MIALTVSIQRPERTATATVARNFRLAWTTTHPHLSRAGIFLVSHGLAAADWAACVLVARPSVWAIHHAARLTARACSALSELAEDVQRRTK